MKSRYMAIIVFGFLLWLTVLGRADSGVLIATDVGSQDDNVLSLDRMDVDVKIDNQHSYVTVKQVFASHVQRVLEGQYIFDLPPRSTVADFAVWDGLTRIPAVIMEKRRAEEVYEQIKNPQQIDPGLLTQDDEKGAATAFNVKVTPIPGYGTKRLELEYTEMLPVDGLTVSFVFPFKPSAGRRQRVKELSIRVRILNDLPIEAFEQISKAYPLKAQTPSEHEIVAEYSGENIDLSEDLAFRYSLRADSSTIAFLAYRAPERVSAYDLRDPALAEKEPDGYFQATAIYNQTGRSASERIAGSGRDAVPPREVTILLDNSLSMHGEKIVRAYEAIDFFLHKLRPQDSFNLILFNESPQSFSKEPVAGVPENVERALAFVREAPVEGGTSLLAALRVAIEQVSKSASKKKNLNRSIVLITDANPTLGSVQLKPIVDEFDRLNRSTTSPLVRLYGFGIGGDVRQTLLAELVKKCQGYYVQYRETEDLSLSLGFFFEKVGELGVTNIGLEASNNFYNVYYDPNARSFDGSSFSLVGRYHRPGDELIKIHGLYEGSRLELKREVTLPEFDNLHDHLPRIWARARVDALLREIDLNGEREDLISEIIRLSQKYKFVTPYTAFIAAPRALLRPRLIQPGDPVIRVKTDPSVVSVTAVLPFGLVLPLTYLKSEQVWEGRFLAPKNTPDGLYKCRLILTDRKGVGYDEEKSFVIDSHPPSLRVSVDRNRARGSETIAISVDADPDTCNLTARLYGAQPVRLRWNAESKMSKGSIQVPSGLAPGKYSLIVSAEDFAHNNSQAEVEIEVVSH